MSLNMFWFLPTHGDGHYLGTEEGSRPELPPTLFRAGPRELISLPQPQLLWKNPPIPLSTQKIWISSFFPEVR